MELSLYGRVLQRWFLLIAAGTIIATAIGIGIDYKTRLLATATEYQATSSMQILCTSPGCTYVSGISVTDVDNALLPHIRDAGATQGTSARSTPATCSSLTDFIDPTNGQINVQSVAVSRFEARLCANRAARYLARIQNGNVNALALRDIHTYRKLAAAARKQWLRHLRLAALTSPSKPAKRARLSAIAGQWQTVMNTDLNAITGFKYPAVSPAVVFPARTVTTYYPKPLSPIKTILPAAVVGLVLTFLLATWLETKMSAISASSGPANSETTNEPTRAFTASVEAHPEGTVPQPVAPMSPVAEPRPQAALEESATHPAAQSKPIEGFASGEDDPFGQSGPLATPAAEEITLVSGHESATLSVAAGPTRSELLAALTEPMRQSSELISALVDSSRPSIFVTSPTGAEPKSESAVGLAAAMALAGKRIVLVDADPASLVTRFFGLTDQPGLTDFLGYPEGNVQQLIYPANLSATNGSLWVVPHGIRRHDPTSFPLGLSQPGDGQAWSHALSQLASSGVLVIVDGPSALEHPDLMDPAGQMGGVLVALDKERTGADVTQTYDRLRSRGAHLLGVVANPITIRLGSFAAEDDRVFGAMGATRHSPAQTGFDAGVTDPTGTSIDPLQR